MRVHTRLSSKHSSRATRDPKNGRRRMKPQRIQKRATSSTPTPERSILSILRPLVITPSSIMVGMGTRLPKSMPRGRYGNWTRFVNHSCKDQSVAFTEKTIGDRTLPAVVAERDIDMFQELTISYGKHYWLSGREEASVLVVWTMGHGNRMARGFCTNVYTESRTV